MIFLTKYAKNLLYSSFYTISLTNSESGNPLFIFDNKINFSNPFNKFGEIHSEDF